MSIADRFKHSWEITKLTFSIMKKEKELFVFPILSIIFSVMFFMFMLFPMIIAALAKNAGYASAQPIIFILTYFGLAFIAIFFNVCVVYTAATDFDKGGARFWRTIEFAFSRIHVILLWSLVSASVGILLRILDNMAKNAKGIGSFIMAIFTRVAGLAWSIVTIFVIPGLVYHNLKPFAAIKKSVSVLKKTWGEYLIKTVGVGAASGVFVFLGILVGIPSILLAVWSGSVAWIIITSALMIVYLFAVSLFFNVASQIFDTALYVYAERRVVVKPYTKEMLQHAFKSQRPISQGFVPGVTGIAR